jgi:hypothetical protein
MPRNPNEKAPNVSLANFATNTTVEKCRIITAIAKFEELPISLVCEIVRQKTGVFVSPEVVQECRAFIPTNTVGKVGTQVSLDNSHPYATYLSPLCGDRITKIHRRKVR